MSSKKSRLIFEVAIIALTFFSVTSSAQTTPFELTAPEIKIQNSVYNKLIVLDSRIDTTSLGKVHKGILNQKTEVVPKRPMHQQIRDIFTGLIDTSAQTGIVLFQLRQLNFAELIVPTQETGFCTLRAKLYEVKNGKYNELASIDTTISVNAIDVTNKLYKKGSNLIIQFIADHLSAAPVNGISYTYEDLKQMDKIERSKLKLFTTSTYENGLYKDYNSFKNQTPDYKKVSVQIKNTEITILKIEDGQGKRVVPEVSYALVHDGKPYIIAPEGNYVLRKEGDEFYFTGLSRWGTSMGSMLASTALFGAAGALFTQNANGTNYFDIKLNYHDGSFIPVRQIYRDELNLKRKAGLIPSRAFKDDSY